MTIRIRRAPTRTPERSSTACSRASTVIARAPSLVETHSASLDSPTTSWKASPDVTAVWELRRQDYELSSEQQELRDSFRAYFEKSVGAARVRDAEPIGFDEALWK